MLMCQMKQAPLEACFHPLPFPSPTHPWWWVPLGCHSFIPRDELWHDPKGPTGSIEGLVGRGHAKALCEGPSPYVAKGEKSKSVSPQQCCVSYLSSLLPCRAPSNNALGANKILRNPFLDYSESFIFISGYQHASKAHIN